MNRWKWRVTGYYNDTVKPPKVPGEMALQVVLADDHSKDLEVSVFAARADVGPEHISIERID